MPTADDAFPDELAHAEPGGARAGAAMPALAQPGRPLLWLAAVLWTVAVAAGSAWFAGRQVDGHREKTWSTAAMRLAAVQDALDLTFRHLAAVPAHVARLPAVEEFLAAPPPSAAPAIAAGDSRRVRETLAREPAVVRTSELLSRMAQDFGLPLVALLDRDGVTLAGGASDPRAQPDVLGFVARDRQYFIEALNSGSASQFLFGRLSRGPGLYFAHRVEQDGRALGVAMVKQDIESLNRVLNQPDASVVFVTDANGVVILANHRPSLTRRLPGGPAHTTEEWVQLYQRVPQPLAWSLSEIEVAGQPLRAADWEGRRHLALAAALTRQRYTVWLLAPLGDEVPLLTRVLALAAGAWGFGMLAMWAAWRRSQLLQGALQARRELLDLAQALPLTVFRYQQPASGQGGRFAFLGRGVDELFGVTPAALKDDPGLPWRLAGLPDGAPPTRPTEFNVRRGDRSVRVLAHSLARQRPDGSTVYSGYWLDITARHDAELRFAAVYEHAPTGYLFLDTDAGIVDCNPAAVALFGATDAAALHGKGLWTPPLSPPRQPGGEDSRERAVGRMLGHARGHQRVQTFEWRFQRLDGATFDADVSVIALAWEPEPRFCAVVQDITARKQADLAMRQARADAEAASQTKSSFLANMSHELRTPMNAIIGMTHLAIEDGLPPRQRDYVEKAHGAARNLLQLLDDILDLSKIESGHVALEQVEFELESVVRETTDLLALKADEKGLELVFRLGADLPPRLVGDPTRLRQVLVNLGSNAVKFTDAGEVEVGLDGAVPRDGHVELQAWVRDTGVGLTETQAARLFQPFMQADSSTTRRYGGTGLGLAISRQLVEHMQGRLWVDSAPGQGATFRFTARFGLPPDTAAPAAPPAPPGRRALVVDDNATAREVLADMLERWGLAVDRADSGADAIARVARDPQAYDWLLIDWRMPGMDGVACLRALARAHPGLRGAVLLAGAFARGEATRAAADLPLAAVLGKPVTPAVLRETLKAAGRGDALPSSRAAAPARDETRARLAGARILLAEDHPLNRELAGELLRRAGMDVVVAENGEEVLQRLASDGPFDGVLMDCQMPVMDGYTATRRLRADPAHAELPVIAMTASALAEDRDRALAAGMNAHIAKPIDVEGMLRTMAAWIVSRRTPPERLDTGPGTDWQPASGMGAIDTADGLARCLGRTDLYRRILRGFRDASLDFNDRVGEALARGEWKLAAGRTHDLKGLAGTIGAHGLHGAAQALQLALRADDAAAAARCLRIVAEELDAVLAEIAGMLAHE